MAEKESWEKQETWDKYVDTGGEYKFDEEMLKRAFEEARKVYKERGFQRRMGLDKEKFSVPVFPAAKSCLTLTSMISAFSA
jgi:hypothetical protein